MQPFVKVLLGLGAASSAVGAGFLIKNSLSTTDKTPVPETPTRVLAHSLFEKKFGGKRMIAKDDWGSWTKKVQEHKNQSYWPSSLYALTSKSLPDSSVASALQLTCFNIDNGSGKIKDDALLKKNFEPETGGHESVNLEEVASKLCAVE